MLRPRAATTAVAAPVRARGRLDIRPVGYVIGLVVAVMGALMLVPMTVDFVAGNANWTALLESAIITVAAGGLTAIGCANGIGRGLTLQQSFLLTSGIWLIAPLFGALPLMLGAPYAGFTDAYFEAVSGITTTGATVFTGLDGEPPGMILWRSTLQWLGGLGIVIVAMIFLPVMKVGGMQFFRTEGFDTLGKILPRALDIAKSLLWFYILLTLACIIGYAAFGMTLFEAVVHAFSTVSTGGFSSSDASFGKFLGPLEWVATFFMFISSVPYIRFVQALRGSFTPLWRDPQTRAYVRYLFYANAAIVAWRAGGGEVGIVQNVREALFNTISVMSGTGFSSASVAAWGAFPLIVVFMLGFIGGCTGSSSGGCSVFRFQLLFEAIRTQIQAIHSPQRVVQVHYADRLVDDDVLYPVVAFFSLYFCVALLSAVLIGMSGLDAESAVLASWTSIGNIGAAFGPATLQTGTMIAFPDLAKWVMLIEMLLGRLGLFSLFVLLMPRFWRG